MEISTTGLDLAKSIFQVHAISTAGETVVCKALRRSQVLPPAVRGRDRGMRHVASFGARADQAWP